MGLGSKIVWKCDVCKHEWLPRDDSKPLRCASCKTPYWDKKSNTTLEQARESLRMKKRRRA